MNERERDALIEAAVTPNRERDPEGRIVPPPAWWDLSEADCVELFRRQLESRLLEQAVDPRGLSGTVRAVLSKIEGPR